MPTIFLSYSSVDKFYADKIDNVMTGNGFYVKRDVRDITYKQNIKEFMSSVSESDFVITLISNSFLRSRNCMYEMLELVQKVDYKKRVLQIILPNAKVFKIEDRINYLQYWIEEVRVLESKIEKLDEDLIVALQEDLKVSQQIRITIAEFTEFLSNQKGITIRELEEENFKHIFDYIGIHYKPVIPPISNDKRELRPLNSFNKGDKFYGKIKHVLNYGFFIQVHSPKGYRDGLLHKEKLFARKYDFKQLKRFFSKGDDIHVEISDINFSSSGPKGTAGLGFIPTEQFQIQLEQKIIKYLEKAKEDKVEEVNLSGLGLKKIPKEIMDVKSLKSVCISQNNFQEIPSELDALPNLKTVMCDFNPKRKLNYNYIIYDKI